MNENRPNTYIWYTFLEGYRARILNISKENNWYKLVRPDSEDTLQWDLGWDLANSDLKDE